MKESFIAVSVSSGNFLTDRPATGEGITVSDWTKASLKDSRERAAEYKRAQAGK